MKNGKKWQKWGQPPFMTYGDIDWVKKVVKNFGLEQTLRQEMVADPIIPLFREFSFVLRKGMVNS